MITDYVQLRIPNSEDDKNPTFRRYLFFTLSSFVEVCKFSSRPGPWTGKSLTLEVESSYTIDKVKAIT